MPDGASYGAVFNAFQNVLEDAIERLQPAVVGIEDAIPQRDNRAHTARLTLGLHAVADLVCFQAGIKQERPTVGRIRSAVIGRSKLTPLERAIRPRVTVKNQIVLPWCVARGWDIDSPDARDAAVGWAFVAGIRAPRKRASV